MPRVHISEGVPNKNAGSEFRWGVSKEVKTQRAEEILCQTRRRVRSLLVANEELAYRSAVQNLPAICVFYEHLDQPQE